jgi:hypothetical protein
MSYYCRLSLLAATFYDVLHVDNSAMLTSKGELLLYVLLVLTSDLLFVFVLCVYCVHNCPHNARPDETAV